MRPETAAPSFETFLRFLASRYGAMPKGGVAPDRVLAAAREAHGALSGEAAPKRSASGGNAAARTGIEILELLAASSQGITRPSDLVTARGFRVRLDYRDGTDAEPSSICVLVQCPEQMVDAVQGQLAYLWNGAERFELGEFDVEGKAIGTLPAGIEITLADFATGRIKLEAPEATGTLGPPE